MSSEDEQLKARIAAMAGQINRVKNQQAGFVAPPPAHHYPPQRGGYNARYQRPAPYATRYRGRGGSVPIHRHKTLVLNGVTQANNSPDADSGTDSSSSSWVQKNDRHLQLINKSVYNQDSQARIQAMEQTRRQKLASRDQQERAKLFGHLTRIRQSDEVNNAQGPSSTPREIVINGVRYLVSKNGSKLVRAPDETSSLKSTPKVTEIAGVKFRRSKTGNLIRQGVIKAQRRQMGIKKVNEPCRMFSTTGSCVKGPRCRYQHDPWKTAVCKELLQKGECKMGDACDLSHDMTPERMPTCLHFLRDQCTNPSCKFGHAKIAPGAPVCRSFGLYGYCEKGAACPERHAFECPDFSNTGVCKTKGCKLLHREKASVQRKQNNNGFRGVVDDDDAMEDVDSDDDDDDDDGDSVSSNDVDSDEIDEFIGPEDDGLDFEQQKDYIAF